MTQTYWHCGTCGTAQHTGSAGCIFCGPIVDRGRDAWPEPARHLTRRDYGVLDTLLAGIPVTDAAHAPLLYRLITATVLGARDRPADLVSLEATVRFRVDGSAPAVRRLSASERAGLLSVLTPLGIALIGCRAGARAFYHDRQNRPHELTVEAVVAPPPERGNEHE